MRGPLLFLISGRCWRAQVDTRCGNRSSWAQRQGESHRRPSVVSQTDGAAVRLRDRLHNGKPKTGATPSARRRCKALERMGEIAFGKAGTMIMDLYLNSVTGAPSDQLHIPSTMRQRVVHQVA